LHVLRLLFYQMVHVSHVLQTVNQVTVPYTTDQLFALNVRICIQEIVTLVANYAKLIIPTILDVQDQWTHHIIMKPNRPNVKIIWRQVMLMVQINAYRVLVTVYHTEVPAKLV
jgi:hypothetical protein